MQPISLYLLTREQDPGIFALYERHLSGRQLVRQTNRREQESLRALVEDLLSDREGEGLSPEQLSGFYYSYTIRHISKEFDLVKFPRGRNCVLNIELKNSSIPYEGMEEKILDLSARKGVENSHIAMEWQGKSRSRFHIRLKARKIHNLKSERKSRNRD